MQASLDSIPEDPDHASGRTIRRMLESLLWLSLHPNEWMEVKDHHGKWEDDLNLCISIEQFCFRHRMRTERMVGGIEHKLYVRYVKAP